ncbi:hypothetical protein [Kribbella italica]|uniref:Uncharacterized protein n=1 Tax=Kribbella italica TaxID=1540520 RepID=A0A7W9JCJ7_9ACTN|nr:hypothetical protein [Kribbella italica]MBB5839647.1 hypothetical protein [Kribbella italica]
MKSRAGLCLLLTATILLAATSPSYAGTAADDPCLRTQPMQSYGGDPEPAVLTTAALRVPVEMEVYGTDADCEGMTITVQRPDGSQQVVVPLTEKVHNEWPTIDTRAGYLTVPLGTGAGRWVMTKVTHRRERSLHGPARAVASHRTDRADAGHR